MSRASGKKGHALRNLGIILVVVAAVFAWRFHQLGADNAVASIRSVQERDGVPVETVAVTRGDLDGWITLAGTVEGVVQYSVVSNNALRVVGIPVREGDSVKRGDVILRLANEAPNPMYHSVSRSRANYDNALREAKRLRNLFAAGAVSRASLDAAETQLKVAEVDLQDAEGSVSLVAGEAGVVTSILVREGETVPTNEPLVWVGRTDSVKISFEAGSAQALALAAGQPATWTSPDGALTLTGAISRLDLMADPQTHLLAGEALFANPGGRLVPGLMVSIRARTAHAADVLLAPTGALVRAGDADGVWVVGQADGALRARLCPVIVGLRTTDRVEVRSGLSEGDRVVLHGQSLLAEGVKVNDVMADGGK